MNQRVSLLFGVHAHQPVGNFPAVLNDAHLRCYRPFLQVLYRYPDFRFAVHFSGWLLDYLMCQFPDDMELLHEMVARKQVELFGAGETEPVLAVIPSCDRIGQINAFSRKLTEKLGQRPHGAWLTERVWESTVVTALADCGIRYVIVDDYHFLCTGKTHQELDGFYTTEEDGRKLDLFPISESLRYQIPFFPVDETVAYLESLADQSSAGQAAAIYFDDIEKFGIWPETYEWVYEKGWLEQFIQKILASSRITTQHYSEYHEKQKTRGIVYLPTVSYVEMNEWTLPASSANQYAHLVQQVKNEWGQGEKKAFLRGGIWKNFFSRYPESNWMHKRMLGLSARLRTLPEHQRTDVMQQKLYQSQANDAYWHGLFGGLYLPHLRRAVYQNLVELEVLLNRCIPPPASFTEDIDLDGVEETCYQNSILQVFIKRDRFASICEFDAFTLGHNFGDTLRRQTEHYHHKLQPQANGSNDPVIHGIASAHDRISYKHEIDALDLVADDHPRGLFVDRLDDVFISYQSLSVESDHHLFQSENMACPIHKRLVLDQNRLQMHYRFMGELEQIFSTEINLAMPSCDGFGGRYIYQQQILGGFGQIIDLKDLTEITFDDDVLQGSIVLKTSHPVALSAYPHFTVSQSESGFEKIMQATTLLLKWPVTIQDMIITLEIFSHKL